MENEVTPKQALKELEEKAKLLICNDCYVCDLVKPIYQALDELEELKMMKASFENDANRLNEQCTNLHLKDKKQTQILEVLKNKEVDIAYLKYCIHYCEKEKEKINRAFVYYNETRPTHLKITETEFNLIKEWLQ